jgi:hypothetical protein
MLYAAMYVSDPDRSFVRVTLEVKTDGAIRISVSIRVSQRVPSASLEHFFAESADGIVRRRHRVVVDSVASSLHLSATVVHKDLKGSRLNKLFIQLKNAMHTAHGSMRKMGLAAYLLFPTPEQFWWETQSMATQRLCQLGTAMKSFRAGPLSVAYTDELAGGGELFASDFVTFVLQNIGNVEKAHEWCAGPGFIGFSLLASGLCRCLSLSDVNRKAIDICTHTVTQHSLEDRVKVFHSFCLDEIASGERWQLVVGNPPWLSDDVALPQWGLPIKYRDLGFSLHRKFFASIGKFLAPEAHILLVESYTGSCPEDFAPMIRAAGLHLRRVYPIVRSELEYLLWITN